MQALIWYLLQVIQMALKPLITINHFHNTTFTLAKLTNDYKTQSFKTLIIPFS